jgi:pterin-4a-carbinolamine dehydratase
VHQWGNPGDEPLIFLAFNVNPEGVAAVLPGAPAEKTIANGGRPTTSIGRSIPQFPKALGLIQDVGELAEGYHPDINFGRVMRLSRRTKKIKGLHENDFIMASKTNRLLDRPDDFLDHKK